MPAQGAKVTKVLNYGSVVWSNCDKEHLGRVLKMQKRAVRVICDATKQTPSVKLFNSLQWLPFHEEVKIARCSIVYMRIMHEVPIYIRDSLELNCQRHDRVMVGFYLLNAANVFNFSIGTVLQ